jgi:glucose dehydrogenase
MSINLARGRNDLDCGCTGPAHIPQTIGWALVIRNGVLVIFALATALPMTSRALSIQDISTIVLASIAVMFLYASIEQSITNQQRQKHYFALKRKDHSDAVS